MTKAVPKIGSLKDKVSAYLYWNGSIRFMMEGYMDIVLFSLMNLQSVEWSGVFWSVDLSNCLAAILTAIFCSLPIYFIFFYACNMRKWNDDLFKGKYGALLEGTKKSKSGSKWIVVMIPTTYFVRRLAMGATLVFWREFFWGQVAL